MSSNSGGHYMHAAARWGGSQKLHGAGRFVVYGCTGARLYGCMVVWLYGCMVVWLYGCAGVWVYGCTGVREQAHSQNTASIVKLRGGAV